MFYMEYLQVMTKHKLTIGEVMVPSPFSVQKHELASEALRFMREHHIHHLPVLDGERLVGIVFLPGLVLLETLEGMEATRVEVSAAICHKAYAVQEDTDLRTVVHTMAGKGYHAALVLNGEKLVGVFTTSDALHVLGSLLS
jgi:acetoin utilization protein AcuB